MKDNRTVPLSFEYNLSTYSTDIVAMTSYAESYNGLGYYNNNRISPYVYSGTSIYKSGKYTADGTYDSNAVDKQPGVLALILSIS